MPTRSRTLWLAALMVPGVVVCAGAIAILPSPVVVVPAGGDLQEALATAHPGETILLEPGATYVGNFKLPAVPGAETRPITVTTRGLPGDAGATRVTPDGAVRFAKIRSPNGSAALGTEPRARGWRIERLEFLANQNGAGDIITLGDGSPEQNSASEVPSDLVVDRVYIHGDPARGQKRAIALNASKVTISNSYISDIKVVGQDSQAIGGWNGPGDFTIENNYLEAAGENLLFGGADPSIRDLVPTHIVVRGNTIAKPLAWKDAGAQWQIKNLFELKNARDVTIEGNVFERNWAQAQNGVAIVLTVRNEDGNCPWCIVENVTVRQNLIRDVAAGVGISGTDNNNHSQQANHFVVTDNVFDGIDHAKWGGNGYFLLFTDNPRDVVVDHNTVIQGESYGIAQIDGRVDGLVLTNNIASYGDYGIIAGGRSPGNDSIRTSMPGAKVTANVMAGGDASLYPPGNFFPSVKEFQSQFVDFANRDYRLVSSSQWVKAATDGRALGANVAAIPRASN